MDDSVFGPPGVRRQEIAVGVGLAAGTAVFLWLFRAEELSANSLAYADTVSGMPLSENFYPAHLMYMAVVRLFSYVLSPVGGCGVQCAGQVHSIVWATVAIVCMYLLLARLTQSVWLGFAGALLLLVSHDFWVFSTQLEVYVPMVGSLLLLAVVLLTAGERWSTGRAVACAGAWAVATLFHQAGAVMFVPVAAYLLAQSGRQSWRKIATVSAMAGGAVLASYVIVYIAVSPPGGFLGWMLGLASVPLTDWGSFGHWTLPNVREALYSQGSSLALLPDEVSDYQLPGQRLAAVVVLVLLAWNAFQAWRRADNRAVRVFFLAWFVALFAFFTWWDPTVHKFFLPSVPPLIALGVITLQDGLGLARRLPAAGFDWQVGYKATAGVVVAATLVTVFTFTLVASIMPLRGDIGPRLGPNYYEANILNDLAPPGCDAYAFEHQLRPLEYYFGWDEDRVWSQTELYEAYFYYVTGQEPPKEYRERDPIGAEPCSVINVYFVSPQRFDSKVRGYIDSPDWQSFLDWFFEVEDRGDGTSVRPAVELVERHDRPPYLIVDRSRRVEAPRGSLAEEITRAVQDNRTVVNHFPSFPGRDRQLIFGYSGNYNSSTTPSLWIELGRIL